MNSYEEKQEARRERIQNAADRASQASTDYYHQSHVEGQKVPLGQPILVGHHSEGRMRAHYKRVGRLMDKSCESAHKAEYLQRKAASVGTGGVSSDDPEAVVKLKAKLLKMETKRETLKAINKVVRSKPKNKETSKKLASLQGLGLNLAQAETLFNRDSPTGWIGIPGYSLTNLGANIRSTKQRIEKLKAVEAHESYQIPFEGGKIAANYDENRVQVFHDDKPSADVRTSFKRNGFRWSRYNTCWQRHINSHAIRIACDLCGISLERALECSEQLQA